MDNVEFLILRNLLHNEEYVRKVIPFIKADYFEDITQKIVFEEISSFVEQYNKPATKEILCIEAEKRSDINDSSYKDVTNLISSLNDEPSEYERSALFQTDDRSKIKALHKVANFLSTLPFCCGVLGAVYSNVSPSPSFFESVSNFLFSLALSQ